MPVTDRAEAMPAESQSLDDLRREIDEIDDGLHDLLIRRTEIARTIGALKGDSAVYIRPDREARILRRLIARHRGAFPGAVLVRIWREIICALTALQGPLSVAASVSRDGPDLREIAREHFGALTPIAASESAMGVLRAVSDGQATVGVLPLPRSDEENPWWRFLAREGDQVPLIVARLPFAEIARGRGEVVEALAVALAVPEESGKDCSYLILETSEQLSRDRVRAIFAAAGLGVRDVQSWGDAPDRRLHLVEVEGFVTPSDARITGLRLTSDDNARAQIWMIGGYAVPLTLEELTPDAARDAAQDAV
jgi:chorismate mutase